MYKATHYLCLSKEEFLVLLFGIGVEKFICFQEECKIDITQEEYNKTLFFLCRKNILSFYNECSLSICDEYKTLFGILESSRTLLRIRPRNNKTYCIYCNGLGCVIAEPGAKESEYIKLREESIDGTIEFLFDVDIFPIIDLEDSILELYKDTMILEQNIESSNEVISEIAICDMKTNLQVGTIRLIWQPLQDNVVYELNDEITIFPYTKNSIKSFMKKIMGEKL